MNGKQQDLSRHSDELLDAVDDLRRTETLKRGETISTPRFHQLADRAEQQAREVFRLAATEREEGDDLPTSSVSIDDVAAGARTEGN